MPVYVVYLKNEDRPRILRALSVNRVDDSFTFEFEAGDNLTLPKSDIVCWDEYQDGETALIRSREDVLRRAMFGESGFES